MNNTEFWKFFEAVAAPQLAHRLDSLRYVFNHLDALNRPVFVVETGCVRNAGTWAGEGQSTILFDKFASSLPGCVVHSVDLNPAATALCKTLVSPAVEVHTGDSVAFLRSLVNAPPPPPFRYIDVLYLDSYDVDMAAPHPSAMHHVKELIAISPLVGPQTLVVVDDAPLEACLIPTKDGIAFVSQPKVGGKGKYVAEYAENIGLKPVFSGYQAGWIGFGNQGDGSVSIPPAGKPDITRTDLFKIAASLNLPPPQGILQVGASYGQELKEFIETHRIRCGVFIEPLPDPFNYLANVCKQLPGMVAVQALCAAATGEKVSFHVSSNGGQSSSILPPGSHLTQFDWVKFNQTIELTTTRLDDVMAYLSANGHEQVRAGLDTLYMDTQGAELMVLQGGEDTLSHMHYVFTEVTRNEMYTGAPALRDLMDFLTPRGFSLNNVNFNEHNHADALFIRNDLLGLGGGR